MPFINVKCNIEKIKIWHWDLINIYDSDLSDGVTISTFVEIGGATIGKNCKIGSGAYICPGTIIGDDVFISHGARFCNIKYPRANTSQKDKLKGATVLDGATIGAGAIILPGVIIGERSLVAAGAVVTRDIPADTVVAGVPAKVIANKEDKQWIEGYDQLKEVELSKVNWNEDELNELL